MIKKILYFSLTIAFVFCFKHGFGQNWQAITNQDPLTYDYRAIYSDSIDNYLYVGGTFGSINGITTHNIARWDGMQWYNLGSGTDLVSRPVEIICRYQGDIFAGGSFLSMGGVYSPKLARWNGSQWDSLSVQGFHDSSSAWVSTLVTINNELWVGGTFDAVNGQPCLGVAIWNGTSWNALGLPSSIEPTGKVEAICEYNGEVYIGGNFSSYLPINEDTLISIIRFDGINWKSVGGGLKGIWAQVGDMVVYNGELYVAGYFYDSQGNAGQGIQKWNGAQWSDVGGGFKGYNDIVCGKGWDLEVHDDKLYAVGEMEYAGGIVASKIAIWDGSQWCGLGSQFDNILTNVGFYNDSLFVLGGFWTIDGDSIFRIAQWIGGNFVDQCGNNSGIEVYGLDFGIYPNPTCDWINISIPEDLYTNMVEYNIYNSTGQKSCTGIINENNSRLNLSILPNGLYYIEIISGNKKLYKKLIKTT